MACLCPKTSSAKYSSVSGLTPHQRESAIVMSKELTAWDDEAHDLQEPTLPKAVCMTITATKSQVLAMLDD